MQHKRAYYKSYGHTLFMAYLIARVRDCVLAVAGSGSLALKVFYIKPSLVGASHDSTSEGWNRETAGLHLAVVMPSVERYSCQV